MKGVFRKVIMPALVLTLAGVCGGQNLLPGAKPDPVRFWISHQGQPWGYLTRNAVFLKEDSGYTHLRELKGVTQVLMSPNGRLALLAQHEPYRSRFRQSLVTRFWIIDDQGKEWFSWEETNAADETRWQAAISDAGVLALLDPGYARLKLIAPNGKTILDKKLIKSAPLEEHTSVFNLERKGRLGWVDQEVIVVLEEQAFRPQHADNILTKAFDRNGSSQWETKLPLTQIQGAIYTPSGLFVSGYDWADTAAGRQFQFQLMQINHKSGSALNQWQLAAKYMAISPNGRWLGLLADAESGYRIDLHTSTVTPFTYQSTTEFLQNIVINDKGDILTIAVSKSNYHPLEIFKSNRIKLIRPLADETFELQTTGIEQDQLHLETSGERFYLGDTQRWREVGE